MSHGDKGSLPPAKVSSSYKALALVAVFAAGLKRYIFTAIDIRTRFSCPSHRHLLPCCNHVA